MNASPAIELAGSSWMIVGATWNHWRWAPFYRRSTRSGPPIGAWLLPRLMARVGSADELEAVCASPATHPIAIDEARRLFLALPSPPW